MEEYKLFIPLLLMFAFFFISALVAEYKWYRLNKARSTPSPCCGNKKARVAMFECANGTDYMWCDKCKVGYFVKINPKWRMV